MLIGVPKEVKDNEYRVSMTPGGVRELIRHGHTVLVQRGAGLGSGFDDAEYLAAGARIVDAAQEAWAAQMVIKVKEPVSSEYGFLRPDLVLFTYLHLAASEELTRVMVDSGVTGIAYETVEKPDGSLPLLQPMSEVAGRMATQIAAHYLQKPEGGRGLLMGGVPGTRPAHVVIIGAGTVGTNAAQVALGMGAQVTLLDVNTDRLRYLDEVLHGRLITLHSNQGTIAESLRHADVLIGAVLLTGRRAPKLVSKEMLRLMPPRSVIVDVAVDQGGIVESTHPTTHSDPIYFVEDILHYGVANMPGAVPRTSSFALSNATLRYALLLADHGVDEAFALDPGLARGLNVRDGRITHPAVAESFGMPVG
ncbi:MAG: alanine dehydrogenase [Candidatus Flexifilum sp.]|jgi:alanine dehydrogenase